MSAPITAAYAALQTLVADALVGCGFLPDRGGLAVDPQSAFEPTPDAVGLEIAAEILLAQVRPVRQLIGSGSRRRWVVEAEVTLVLTASGPAPAGDGAAERMARAWPAIAPLAEDNATLDGLCERLRLTAGDPVDLPPSGKCASFSFIIRLRAGDPLGQTSIETS